MNAPQPPRTTAEIEAAFEALEAEVAAALARFRRRLDSLEAVIPCPSVAPHSLRPCALPAGHGGRHESSGAPAIVWDDPKCAKCGWVKSMHAGMVPCSFEAATPDAPAEEPAASYKPGADATGWDAGRPLCESFMLLPSGNRHIVCTLDEGHDGPHSALHNTWRWTGSGHDARRDEGSRLAPVADDGGPAMCNREEPGPDPEKCARFAGHPMPHRTLGGHEWGAVAGLPPCVCGDEANAHGDIAGTRRAPCTRRGCTCPDYEVPAGREHEVLPVRTGGRA